MILIFPGQGSQFVGMGEDLYQNFSEVKLLFEEVSDVLHYNIAKIIFENYQNKLNITQYTQPAIMTISMAVLKVLQARFGLKLDQQAKYLMGHSLGEYSALCAAESLNISETAKLLDIRGKEMQNACPDGKGTMLALLGATIEQAEKISLKIEGCQIANDNGGGQIVLSCLTESVEKIKQTASELKIKRAIPLQVSGPFHSSFMKPAADKMKQVLSKVKIQAPKLPIITNVSASRVHNPDEIKSGLVQQITDRVRWRESVIRCIKSGAQQFIEIGPGTVLTNLVKRIDRSAVTTSIGTIAQIKEYEKQIAVLND